jgi:hypothetical protein
VRRGQSHGYALWTSRGTGSYQSWERAVGAARWAAEQTSSDVSMVSGDSGAMWDISPEGQVSRRSV